MSGDLVLGGRYQLEGNAGGTVRRCEEPALLEVTWEFGGGVSLGRGHAHRGRRRHPAPARAHRASRRDHSDEFGPGAVGIGWEMGLGGLRLHLAEPGGTAPRPRLRGPGLLRLRARLGHRLGRGGCRRGHDPEQAKAAAERCIAAYTALPPDEGQD